MLKNSVLITILGFAGFFMGCFTLFNSCGGLKSQFHEVEYNPVEIVDGILRYKIDSITKKKDSLVLLRKSVVKEGPEKSLAAAALDSLEKIDSLIKKNSSVLEKLEGYYKSNYINVSDDTLLWAKAEAGLKSSVNLDSLANFDFSYRTKGVFRKIELPFTFYDPETGIDKSYKTIALSISGNSKTDVDFFTKYPGFGIWALLILAFCCCVAMTIGVCIDAGNELAELVSNKACQKTISYWPSFVICVLLLAAFFFVIKNTLYDSDSIKDLYFMNNLGSKILFISIFGYAAAAFCFAGMISTASYAKCFKDKVLAIPDQQPIQTAINGEIDGLKNSLLNQALSATEIADIQLKLTAKTAALAASQLLSANAVAAESDHAASKQLFRKFFYAIALLLALLVFCTGTLYSAVDNLDFIRMIKSDMGYSPARHDFIFLYAALHTLLILLFYLPAQLQLGGLPEGEAKKGFLNMLGEQLKKTTELLVVGAPLVAGFAQWLLNMIFEN